MCDHLRVKHEGGSAETAQQSGIGALSRIWVPRRITAIPVVPRRFGHKIATCAQSLLLTSLRYARSAKSATAPTTSISTSVSCVASPLLEPLQVVLGVREDALPVCRAA